MRIRFTGVMLGLLGILGLGVTACGGSSSSASQGSTPTTAATSTTSAATTGGRSPACTQASQILQSLSKTARANPTNPQAVIQAVQTAIPQLQALANQASGSTKSALNNLVSSLQAVVNGQRGPNSGLGITNAAVQLGTSCV